MKHLSVYDRLRLFKEEIPVVLTQKGFSRGKGFINTAESRNLLKLALETYIHEHHKVICDESNNSPELSNLDVIVADLYLDEKSCIWISVCDEELMGRVLSIRLNNV